ncbi:hypothetical protein [Sphingobium cupriresistens]|uniref:Uncharacterized protein n=1 Tax=Sphingobium cupriresistens TaxID=1132417 RepID=A0A8G2DWS0_9SPHN|nr:hypothetical protein [Sphingobium cupriresistens]RYM07996.1 hypothetical protein EWH12_17835 [Sphingobium cupriresistens]
MKAALDGYSAARKAEIEALTYQARLVVNLGRYPKAKYLPSLQDLLRPAKPDAPQSTDDMLAAFQDMQAAGAPIEIRKVA